MFDIQLSVCAQVQHEDLPTRTQPFSVWPHVPLVLEAEAKACAGERWPRPGPTAGEGSLSVAGYSLVARNHQQKGTHLWVGYFKREP